MIAVLTGILHQCWIILNEAAPYVLFGFFAAGVLKALIPEQLIARHLGSNSFKSVFKASLFGIPLPLCSCGVIPAAIGLRQQGASKGATASFLVSVPETGVDSIAITWALLDPLMTVIRPVAAFLTAILTGTLINRLPDHQTSPTAEKPACSCSDEKSGKAIQGEKEGILTRLLGGLRYAFGSLLKDIGQWLMLGILIAGIISFLVPDDFIAAYLGGGFGSLLLMLLVGIPLYICASASTPIAAALVLKGLSPGAALVFLLAGPATNAATLTVIAKHLGKAATAIYLLAIAACSLALGWLTNAIYSGFAIDITAWAGHADHTENSKLHLVATLILLVLLLKNYLPSWKQTNPDCGCQEDAGGG